MAKFVTFDGQKTFFNVDQILSLATGSYMGSCVVTLIDGRSINLQMSVAQAIYLIQTSPY